MSDLDIFGRFTGRNPSSRCFRWQDWAFPRDYVAGNSRLRDGPGLQGTWVSFMGSVDRSGIKFNKLVICHESDELMFSKKQTQQALLKRY